MGLHKQYLKYGQTATDQLFGGSGRNTPGKGRPTPLSMLISQGAKFNHKLFPSFVDANKTVYEGIYIFDPINQLQKNRLAVIVFGIVTLILGVILSSIPWLDYFILKNLRLWNNSLSFHYWQRPGVIRLTRVYLYNVTNPDGFLSGDKPKLEEVGPFVYREDMEKVNIKFYDNYTVSYQHKKILKFVPELSIDKNTPIITPNIPLLTLTSQTSNLGYFLGKTLSVVLSAAKYTPFIKLTADQFVFGYDDALVSLAHRFYPKHMRPMDRMGLLIGRNGTLTEISTINTGHTGMDKFGYLNQLNGLDHIPQWTAPPCTSIFGSEGSFFPPRDITHSDTVYIYDKDLCRVIPLVYNRTVNKDGIDADLYEIADNAFGDSANNEANQCFDESDYEAVKGLQNISPCQYGAPIYISNPHFYGADPSLLSDVEGLKPNRSQHTSYFKIQPKIGVPLEGKVRIQINLKVTKSKHVRAVQNFRDFVFPIMWLEEGISELTPSIRRWLYLATVFAPNFVPILSYFLIIAGSFIIVFVFIRAYQNFLFGRDPTIEILEMGRRSLRRGSSFLQHQQHKLSNRPDSYVLLKPSLSVVEADTTDLPT